MSFGRVNRPSYDSFDEKPYESSYKPPNSNYLEQNHRRSSNSNEPDLGHTHNHKPTFEDSYSHPAAKNTEQTRFEYQSYSVKPKTANPEDRPSSRAYSRRYEQSQVEHSYSSNTLSDYPANNLTRSNNAILISDRQSIEPNHNAFRKSNEYQTIDRYSMFKQQTAKLIDSTRPVDYRPRAREFGNKETFHDKPARYRYTEPPREDQPIIIFTTDFKKQHNGYSGSVPYTREKMIKSMKLLQGPSYEDLKKRLHSQDF